jgi:hypothetical protein
MIRIQKLAGVQVNNADLPTITRTAEGIALGGIPSWKALLDPAYPVGDGVRNRALPNNVFYALAGAIPLGTFPNTAPAFDMGTISTKPSSFAFNPTEFTVCFVVKMTNISAIAGRYILVPRTLVGDGLSPCIGIRTNDTICFFGTNSSNIRLSGPALIDDEETLIMFTFNTDSGLKCFKNGVLFSSAPSETDPLDDQYSETEFSILPGNSGTGILKVGQLCVFDIDLGKTENAGYRRTVEDFMMTKYGIA